MLIYRSSDRYPSSYFPDYDTYDTDYSSDYYTNTENEPDYWDDFMNDYHKWLDSEHEKCIEEMFSRQVVVVVYPPQNKE